MASVSTSEFRNGLKIEITGEPFIMVEFQHVKPGKGGAFVRTKLKSLKTGSVLEKTFRSGEKVDAADVEEKEMQYLYKDKDSYVFMDNESYEQFSLPKSSLGNKSSFLKEDTEVTILNFNEKPIDIVLPIKMNFKVISSPPGIKGDSAQSGNKRVEIETGLKIEVPLFIKEGDTIKINTEKGSYAERV